MKLKNSYIQKIDDLLRDRLARARGGEILCAVMLLGTEEPEAANDAVKGKLPSAQFSSRVAYRKALIEQRRTQLDHQLGGTLRALKEFSLAPREGTISRTVVVKGPARQILRALELPGVVHVSLDQSIRLITPRRRGQARTRRKS